MLCERLAQLNDHSFIDVAGTFFFENVRETDWQTDPAICDLLHPGNVYGGFRQLPKALVGHPDFDAAPKVLLVRDPRDALVSVYFSNAYSHPIPARREAMSPATDMMEQSRREALASEIDAFVLKRGSVMRRHFLEYVDLARSPRTAVARYEDYIFKKPDLVRLIVRHFDWTVEESQIQEMMSWADRRPSVEDSTAFVRKVTPGDHREKLRPNTIAALNELLKPALDAFGYSAE